MATRFELVLHGPDPVALRAAGEEALAEIQRLEDRLSLYRNTSEIAHVNARAAREPVRVSAAVFRLLAQAIALGAAMDGAFDVTIAPLVRCWGFMGGTGKMPGPEQVAEARARVGAGLIELDPPTSSVRFLRQGVMIDLGAIGKGYAVEQAVEILREAGVTSAMLHGGTSTVYALGTPPDGTAWNVAIERPRPAPDPSAPGLLQTVLPATTQPPSELLAVVPLVDEALSVSAVWGRSFQEGDRTYGHVIDPRSGEPVRHSALSAVVLPSATETDALSTALLTLGPAGLPRLRSLRPAARALVAGGDGEGLVVERMGLVSAGG
jgi:thiamine biosynthesis lipoprotein